MYLINSSLIKEVTEQARTSPRLRKNYNFHPTLDDILQRMLNALEPGTYVQPHKHENPNKVEAFILLTGKLLVIEFDNLGEIEQYAVLSQDSGSFGAEIPAGTWHSIIALTPGTVVYEVKNGPYSPIDDKNFASWAPKEGDTGCEEYLNSLVKQCGL